VVNKPSVVTIQLRLLHSTSKRLTGLGKVLVSKTLGQFKHIFGPGLSVMNIRRTDGLLDLNANVDLLLLGKLG
jgi:hypothetical protein